MIQAYLTAKTIDGKPKTGKEIDTPKARAQLFLVKNGERKACTKSLFMHKSPMDKILQVYLGTRKLIRLSDVLDQSGEYLEATTDSLTVGATVYYCC